MHVNHAVFNLQPKKSFGQNFLVQHSAIKGITEAVLSSNSIRILEIGPGPGVLTELLLEDSRFLLAIELDSEACSLLEQRFEKFEHFHLIHGDAVTVPLPDGSPWSVVGNLPYNAATAIFTRFLLEPIPWERMVLMFQLEVGQKLMGKPGEKAYGPLSVLAQLCTRMTRLMKLGPGAFRPAPKVDSVVLLFEPVPEAPDHETRRDLLDLLHRSFAHRRKTLVNNWNGWLASGDILEILEREGLPPAIRAEAILPRHWVSILDQVRMKAPKNASGHVVDNSL